MSHGIRPEDTRLVAGPVRLRHRLESTMARPLLSLPIAAGALMLAVATTACAPTPEAVCDHMLDVAARDGLPTSSDTQRDACIDHVESEKERMGYMAYRSEARCVLDADGIEAIRACADG